MKQGGAHSPKYAGAGWRPRTGCLVCWHVPATPETAVYTAVKLSWRAFACLPGRPLPACLQQVAHRLPLADHPRGGAVPPAAGSEAAEAAEDALEEEELGRDVNRADFQPWKE